MNSRALARVAGFVAGTTVLGVCGQALAQNGLVVGVDDINESVYIFDTGSWVPLFSGHEVWGMAADDARGIIYFNDGTDLKRWDRSSGVQLIGTINVGGTAKSMTGLAFGQGTLWGTSNVGGDGGPTPEALYTIDETTGNAAVRFDYTAADYDFGGIDIDPDTGTIYGINDDTTPFGGGLFEIDPGTSTITKIADAPTFPGSGAPDIDGLAIGGGRAYLIVDEVGEFAVYNLMTNQFEPTIRNPWVGSDIFSGGAWAPSLLGLSCYPDCDGNTALDIFDFLCFQDAFVQMDPYADCDGNTVFDIFDFLCFQDAFVTGCP